MARIKSARSAGDWAKARDMLPEQHKIPMGSVDTAWLRMDSAVNRMVIVGVWVVKPGITPLTLICGASTRASDMVIVLSAPLLAT